MINNPKISADIAKRIAPCFGDKRHKEVRASASVRQLCMLTSVTCGCDHRVLKGGRLVTRLEQAPWHRMPASCTHEPVAESSASATGEKPLTCFNPATLQSHHTGTDRPAGEDAGAGPGEAHQAEGRAEAPLPQVGHHAQAARQQGQAWHQPTATRSRGQALRWGLPLPVSSGCAMLLDLATGRSWDALPGARVAS